MGRPTQMGRRRRQRLVLGIQRAHAFLPVAGGSAATPGKEPLELQIDAVDIRSLPALGRDLSVAQHEAANGAGMLEGILHGREPAEGDTDEVGTSRPRCAAAPPRCSRQRERSSARGRRRAGLSAHSRCSRSRQPKPRSRAARTTGGSGRGRHRDRHRRARQRGPTDLLPARRRCGRRPSVRVLPPPTRRSGRPGTPRRIRGSR